MHFYSLDITTNPANVLAVVGTIVNLMCEASGASNLKYRWMRKGDENIPAKATGINTRKLTIPNIALNGSGQYNCVVSSDGASMNSEYGTVTVLSELKFN